MSRPSMSSLWVCHACLQVNNAALCPERCSVCPHDRCPYCETEGESQSRQPFKSATRLSGSSPTSKSHTAVRKLIGAIKGGRLPEKPIDGDSNADFNSSSTSRSAG